MKLDRRRRLRFLPLAPVAVFVLGIATAVVVALFGRTLLEAQSKNAAALRARALSEAMAARLSVSEAPTEGPLLERAERAAEAEILVVDHAGRVIFGSREPAPSAAEIGDLLRRGDGACKDGRLYHATPIPPRASNQSVITFVKAPETVAAARSLGVSIGALTLMLVGVAALVAFAIARDVRADVAYLRDRIIEMARPGGDPVGKPVPVRAIDQIGLLTSAFNVLVERFTAAERAYRQDLAGALAYDRDRSAFLAALSHELRTPLNAILGFADVLLSEVDGPLSADARENLEVVRSSGAHLRALIDDILELSALESGELELSRNEIDVLTIAEEVVREARVTVQGKPLSIELEGKRTPAWGDARRVRQILGNLVGNAVKFTTEGSVRLEIGPEAGGWALIRISDTGPGIPAEDHAEIFEEFKQSGDANSQRAGSGLGLAITRRLVQMHGGTVELESSVGRGSSFSIWLPQNPPEPSPDSSVEPALVEEIG